MNRGQHSTGAAQAPAPMGFARWTLIFTLGWAVCQAAFLVLVALAAGLRFRTLGVPYLLLVWSGYVGGVLIWWAHLSYERPRSGAVRLATAIFFFMDLYMGALVFAAYYVHLLSQQGALFGYGPYILPTAALGFITVYIMTRRRLEAFRQSDAGARSQGPARAG
jgi:hypothetical protein